MSVSAFLLRQRRAAGLIAVALCMAGVAAALSLPSSIYPPLEFPRVVVIAHAGTLPSQAMMLTVTQPIEQVVMTVPGIRRVRSTSFRGSAEISAQFDDATDMVVALQQVQNRIAEIRGDLPADTDLVVERLTPAAFPVLILSLTGPLPTPDLRDYAYYVIRPALARVAGVGGVEVLASDSREIEVVLDPERLRAARLTVADVADSLRTQNALQPVGKVNEAGRQWLVLASGLWAGADEIAQSPVVVSGAAALRVADIGTVTPGAPDRTLLVTGNGIDAASISISQQIGANVLSIKRGVDDAVAGLGKTLPAGLHVTRVYDLAEFVSSAIANVRDAILIGGVLAVMVLLLFLRNVRLTVIAALTLPLAVVPTFFFMKIAGASVNLMSMGGLAVAIGLVIDDAVVVVENIHRQAEAGAGAAADAIGELITPLTSSTLTSVVVFAPLGLLSGVVGQFFRALSLTLSVAILLSLFLAVTVVPGIAGVFAREPPKRRPHDETAAWIGRYDRALWAAIRHTRTMVVVACLLGAAGIGLLTIVPTGFLPHADEGGFVLDYLMPAGTALDETDRVVRGIERVLTSTPEIASFSRRTGSELGLFATSATKGDILVRLKPRSARSKSADEVIADLRPRVEQAAPAAEIEFVQLLQDMIGDLEGEATPLEVKIFGDDAATLAEVAEPVEKMLDATPGVVDVVGIQKGNPEITWHIDPVAASRVGLTTSEVGRQLSAAWLGSVATDLRLFDRRVPVRVRLPDRERFDPSRLGTTLLRGSSGSLVPLAAVSQPERADGQATLMRENLRQMALVTARLEGRDLGSTVADVQKRLGALKLPVGYSAELGGQYASQQRAFRELLTVVSIAAALVLVVLLVQFQAFIPALLVLGAAPLSLGGALLVLVLTGTELNVSSAMGVILLVGLVVKNGIMLLDVAEHQRAGGRDAASAIAIAGRLRLRPILMTTLCTVFGLAPLAFGLGAGAELQRPLALAVIGGLTVSTAVTLLVLPSLYVAAHRQ